MVERLACAAHSSRYYRRMRRDGHPPARLVNQQRKMTDADIDYGSKLLGQRPKPSCAEVARKINERRAKAGQNPVSYSAVYRVVCCGEGYRHPE